MANILMYQNWVNENRIFEEDLVFISTGKGNGPENSTITSMMRRDGNRFKLTVSYHAVYKKIKI